MEKYDVGFIGLGAMGGPMVDNLATKLPSNVKIHLYDVVSSLVDMRCETNPERFNKAFNPAMVAAQSKIIITMLPESRHVRSVYLDPDSGLVTAALNEKLLIDCSTIDTATCLDVQHIILKDWPNASFFDAPVSGGTLGATSSQLAFFLGCSNNEPMLPKVTEILSLMGSRIVPCGGLSLGLAAKLAHNYLGAIITIACSEAMDMGIRAGLDPVVLAGVFGAGAAQNRICDQFNPVPGICPKAPSSNSYTAGFKVELHHKDFLLALEMARRGGSTLALADASLKVLDGACSDPSYIGKDSSIVYRYLGGVEKPDRTSP